MYVTPTTLEQSYEYVKALKPKKLVLDILDDNLNFPSISASKKEKLTICLMIYASRLLLSQQYPSIWLNKQRI